MGKILVTADREIIVRGTPPFRLPDIVAPDFAIALLATEPGDKYFVAEVARCFTPSDKKRLRKECKRIGGSVWDLYRSKATKWSSLINNDNRWHIEDFDVIYRVEIGSDHAKEIIVTSANVRFVSNGERLLTFPEFELTYGINVSHYLEEFRHSINETIDECQRHITSDVIQKNMSVIDPNGHVQTKGFIVLESQDEKDWRLPNGYTLLSPDE